MEGRMDMYLLILREYIDIRGWFEVTLLFLQLFPTSITCQIPRRLIPPPLVGFHYLLQRRGSLSEGHWPSCVVSLNQVRRKRRILWKVEV